MSNNITTSTGGSHTATTTTSSSESQITDKINELNAAARTIIIGHRALNEDVKKAITDLQSQRDKKVQIATNNLVREGIASIQHIQAHITLPAADMGIASTTTTTSIVGCQGV
jgi:hypothetical protein